MEAGSLDARDAIGEPGCYDIGRYVRGILLVMAKWGDRIFGGRCDADTPSDR